MKQEEILKSLIEELFKMDNLHHEYTDNNSSYVIDSQKEGNTLTIKVSLKENEDKKEFENWVNDLDDEIFNETWESLSEDYGLKDLNCIYDSDNYKQIIDLFKTRTKEIASDKIKKLQKILN